jgi:hypothetical protein
VRRQLCGGLKTGKSVLSGATSKFMSVNSVSPPETFCAERKHKIVLLTGFMDYTVIASKCHRINGHLVYPTNEVWI